MSAAGGVSHSFCTLVALLPFSLLPSCHFAVVEHGLVPFDCLPHRCQLTPFPPHHFSFQGFELCLAGVVAKAGAMAACELSLAAAGQSSSSAPRAPACHCLGRALHGRERGEVWGGRTDRWCRMFYCSSGNFTGCLRGGGGQVSSGASGWCESPSSGGFSPRHTPHGSG